VPNAISMLRLALVPVFVYLVIRRSELLAVAVLALAGLTDWLDGFAARRLKQFSRLGRLLDPAADRLYILSTVVLLAWRGLIPWWLVALLALREAVMALDLALIKSRGISIPDIVFVGKAATLALMYAFPLLLLADQTGWIANLAWVVGWAFALWGVVLYWVACGAYLIESCRAIQQVQRQA
jgi:cardiolipin synthase